jgi:uncharacterized membrane protein
MTRLSQLRQKVKGQTLVIVVLVAAGVLFGFVALAVDGGSALVQRRNMQNGADAASLGAAQTLAASVVLSSGVSTYSATNMDVVNRVERLLRANHGGNISVNNKQPTYDAVISYGSFIAASST